MKRTNSYLLYMAACFTAFLLLFSLNGCTPPKRNIKRISARQKFVTPQTPFTKLQLNTVLDAKFVHSPDYLFLEIEGPKEVLDFITVKRKGDLLIIQDKNYLPERLRKNTKICIGMADMRSIELGGTGDVTSQDVLSGKELRLMSSGTSDIKLNLKGVILDIQNSGTGDMHLFATYEKCTVSNSGTADLYLKGTVESFVLHNSGTGNVRAHDFHASGAEIHASGTGNVSCYANKRLVANTSGTSRIVYYGSPTEKELNSLGTGDIIKR